jgi:hypothetical protein
MSKPLPLVRMIAHFTAEDGALATNKHRIFTWRVGYAAFRTVRGTSVRFWHGADLNYGAADVGLAAQTGHGLATVRRPLAGAMAVIRYAKWRGATHQPWLDDLIARRPTKVAPVALANNKMARMAWALLRHGGAYRHPIITASL